MTTIEGKLTLSESSFKNYSLEQLKSWLHDTMDQDTISAQEIYDVIMSVLTEDIDYHTRQLDRRQKFLSLLKDVQPQSGNVTEATPIDWKDFWYSPEEPGTLDISNFYTCDI